jgi:hypothetical protein
MQNFGIEQIGTVSHVKGATFGDAVFERAGKNAFLQAAQFFGRFHSLPLYSGPLGEQRTMESR